MNPLEHQHGGEFQRDLTRFGLPQAPLIDLSVNLCPLGPPRVVQESWSDLYETIQGYPNKAGEGIQEYYQERYGWPKDWCLPLNGSMEGIYLFAQALRPTRALLLKPSFFDYGAAIEQAGGEILWLDSKGKGGFGLPPLHEALAQVDACILASPNNPTGHSLEMEQILELANSFRTVNFLVDLAFVQFSDKQDSLQVRELPQNLYLLHSLTKYYNLAGLRLGALLAHPASLARFMERIYPWRINALADQTARLLIETRDYDQEVHQWLKHEKMRITEALRGHPKLTLYPSEANFFLARYTGEENLLKEAMRAGFYFRNCSNFPDLDESYLRFAILDPARNGRWTQFLAGK